MFVFIYFEFYLEENLVIPDNYVNDDTNKYHFSQFKLSIDIINKKYVEKKINKKYELCQRTIKMYHFDQHRQILSNCG